MILTLLSPLLGILGSLLPSIVDIFKRKMELKYEIELTKVQIEASLQSAQISLDIQESKADIADAESVRSYDSNVDGGKFINSLRASIRPVITYSFFFLFVVVKLTQLIVAVDSGENASAALLNIWDQDTMALFGAIMGFWFGSRMLERMGYGGIGKSRITVLPTTQKLLNKKS